LRHINSRIPGSRTAIAIDRERKLLFLAVGESVSANLMLATLARLGAKDGMLLDGGGSTSMAIARDQPGRAVTTLVGGWRPVATQVGVRARPLQAVK
jgi:exopolysaccharide biosynthesis protein